MTSPPSTAEATSPFALVRMSLQIALEGSRGEWEERGEFEVRGEVEDRDAYSDEELSVNN